MTIFNEILPFLFENGHLSMKFGHFDCENGSFLAKTYLISIYGHELPVYGRYKTRF